jgi:hypothetical protein
LEIFQILPPCAVGYTLQEDRHFGAIVLQHHAEQIAVGGQAVVELALGLIAELRDVDDVLLIPDDAQGLRMSSAAGQSSNSSGR